MRRNIELEATIVEKYAAVESFLDEHRRRIWAATESRAIGYGGDALVSDATGLSRPTIRKGRGELESGGAERGRIRRAGAGRPGIKQSQLGIKQALEKLVDPVTRGDPQSPLRWTCKSRAKLAAALSNAGWKVSTTTVGRLLHELGYGFDAFGGQGLLVPYGGFSLAGEGSRRYRIGSRFEIGSSLDLSLEGARREPANDAAADHGVMLRVHARW